MCREDCETTEHLFYDCSFVEPARQLLAEWLDAACDLTLSFKVIRFGPLNENVSMDVRNTALVLLSEYRYAIWICRNRVRFDKKVPAVAEFLNFFRSRVVTRIHVDHRRLPLDRFMQMWVSPGMCHFGAGGKLRMGVGVT